MVWFLIFLLFLFAIAAIAKISRLERRLEELEAHLRSAIGRVYDLERHAAEAPAPAPPPPPPPVAAPQPVAVAPPRPAAAPLAPVAAPPAPVPTWGQRMREHLQGEEWEAVVGGNWLNKLGVFVTVIGIALFLGYSLSHMGPAGRVALGFAGSLAMLAAGVILQRRPRYTIYARGLIGGGWAALYFTAYASHAVDAARIIPDARAGAVVLAAVAAGMILHSLGYRSQTVTGLAYFLGFATLAITPLTTFSVVALIPLAASLVYLARRFAWNSMALMGLVATYGVYLASVARSTGGSLAAGQTVLLIYWVLFESFDLLDAAKRNAERGIAYGLFPLNAAGFVAVSAIQWAAVSRETIYTLCAIAVAAYVVSALARARLRPPSSFGDNQNALDRAWAGGYECAVVLAAVLGAVGLCQGFSGIPLTLWLLAEAELLFLAGYFSKQNFLQHLASAVFLLPVARIVAVHAGEDSRITWLSRSLLAWTPVALLSAGAFYLNRALRPAAKYFGYAAAALLPLILGFELPREWVGPGWLLLAAALFEFGLAETRKDFRYQSYGIGMFSVAALACINVFGMGITGARPAWIPQALAAALALAAAARLIAFRPAALGDEERDLVRDATSAAASALLAALAWNVLPVPLVALAWALEGLLLVELGLALSIPFLRWQGHVAGAFACGRLFFANFTGTGATGMISHRVLTVLPVIALQYYLWPRLRDQGEGRYARAYLYSAAVLAAVLMRFEFGRVFTVAGWAVYALALLALGIRWREPDLRWQSYALSILAFIRSWNTNFYIPEDLGGWRVRVLTGAIVIVCFYAGQFLSPRVPTTADRLGRHARVMFSLLATTLAAVLLFYEVSGRVLTVAWGLEGVILLVAGFAGRERALRLSGLVLLMTCIGKLFFYDLRHLETPYRIFSFIVLGVLLLSVSWAYTRFRDAIRRLL